MLPMGMALILQSRKGVLFNVRKIDMPGGFGQEQVAVLLRICAS
jgi:hypothetical protein